MPNVFDQTLVLLGQSSSPVALFALGAVLACPVEEQRHMQPLTRRHPPKRIWRNWRNWRNSRPLLAWRDLFHAQHSQHSRNAQNGQNDWAAITLIGFCKLVLHPLLIVAFAWCLARLGIDVAPSSLQALILVASLPSASNVLLLTQRFDAESRFIARVILATTAVAFFSFPLMAAWVV